jgi:hypothetical protein
METWATFSIIDHLKPIGDQTQEELDQLGAVDYLREAQAGEPSFCREVSLCDAPETRMNRPEGPARGNGEDSVLAPIGVV